MTNIFRGKNILVTGGTGSIGSEIVRKVLQYKPEVVRVLSNDENGLFNLEQELLSYSNLRFLVGDIKDKERLRMAIEDIDFVFHAAALKHVPLCEYNPFEAIKTNVLGTQNVIDACLNNNVKKMIFISTDKAVNPTNVMGASKLLSERLTIAANTYKGTRETVFSCVRFGNVIASRGSVIPLFIDQIRKGGPVTVTDPNMTRFIMSISSAVTLILKAVTLAKGGEIFILKMPALKIGDLANAAIAEFSPRLNQKGKISVKLVGKRPGEKMDEELFTATEGLRAKMIDSELIAIYPEYAKEISNPINKPMSSGNVALLTESEIAKVLKEIKIDG